MTQLRSAALLVAVVTLSAFSPLVLDGGVLSLYNDSEYTITHVYIEPCEEEWSEADELLGADTVLAPGEEIEFDVPVGCWDLRAVVENEVEVDSYRVEVEDGSELEWTITSE